MGEDVQELAHVFPALVGCWMSHYEEIFQIMEQGSDSSLGNDPLQGISNRRENFGSRAEVEWEK